MMVQTDSPRLLNNGAELLPTFPIFSRQEINDEKKVLELLVWSGIPPGGSDHLPPPKGVWAGVGCTSPHGFPLDFLAMPLAGLATGLVHVESPMEFLIADHHATLGGNGADSAITRERGLQRHADLVRIGCAMGLPFTVRFASDIAQDDAYGFVQDWIQPQMALIADEQNTAYNAQAVVDAVWMSMRGRLKIGWSRYPQHKMQPGKGRSDEFNGTDRFAKRFLEGFASIYVRPGVTTDSTHPVGIPYSVHSEGPHHRLMLAGPEAGMFPNRVELASASRQKELNQQVERTVIAWEHLVGSVPGKDMIAKAERIASIINDD